MGYFTGKQNRYNVGRTKNTLPMTGNDLYHLFMAISGMVCDSFTDIIPTFLSHLLNMSFGFCAVEWGMS